MLKQKAKERKNLILFPPHSKVIEYFYTETLESIFHLFSCEAHGSSKYNKEKS